ncbi:MAG: DsbA family protein [Gemmatimonadota bacterium]
MTSEPIRLYYDFTDPLSWLVGHEVERWAGTSGVSVSWIGVEQNPPPNPLLGADEEQVVRQWDEALTAGEPVLSRPTLPFVPWTRKAHELVRLAEAEGDPAKTRREIFAAYLSRGEDIGRVDVLVELARSLGFDRTHAKAVLDVDRFEAAVAEATASALARGIHETPSLEWRGKKLSGFHDPGTVLTFLGT